MIKTKPDFVGISLDFAELNKLRNKLGLSDDVFARALKSGISSAAFHLRNALQSAMINNTFNWPVRTKYPGVNISRGGMKLHGKEMTEWMQSRPSLLRGATAHIKKLYKIQRETGKKTDKATLVRALKMLLPALPAPLSPSRPLGGKLVKIMRYYFDPDSISAEVGVLDEITGRGSVAIMRRFQEGNTRIVTPSVRKYMAAIGMPISRGRSYLGGPSQRRPLFGPVYEREKAPIMALLQLVIGEKLEKGFAHTDYYDRML